MTEDAKTDTTDDKPAGETSPSTETGTPPAGDKPTDQQVADAKAKEEMDALPEWARKALTKANGEAANYRTQLRDAQTKLEGAKTPEEFATATEELKQKNAELERTLVTSRIASKYDLPAVLAARLVGTTEEELEKDAKALLATIKVEPDRLGGGLDPGAGGADTSDPRLLRQRGRRRR